MQLKLDIAAWFEMLPSTQCLNDGDLSLSLSLTVDHLRITDNAGGCALNSMSDNATH